MAIAQNSTILASDVNSVKTKVNSAYNKTKGSDYSWANTISAGTLATHSHFTEIYTALNTATNNLVTKADCTNNSVTSCSSYKSHRSQCGNHSQDNASFFNNKCGGEWLNWRGIIFLQQKDR